MASLTEHHGVDLLRERGVFLMPYGLPALPRAADQAKVKRQIEKGIPMPSGNTVAYNGDMIDALAAPWLEPDLMVSQFRSPRYKPTRAGMAATVTGLAASPLLQTNLFNPRALMKVSIPESDDEGRVAVPWAPTDRRVDPACAARMAIHIPIREELNERVLESERHILADQTVLADLVTREGVQEDLLGIVVNYQTPGLARRLAVTTIDGNSRVAIARREFRDWINSNRDEIIDVVRSRRPRLALGRLLDQMRDGLFPLEFDDTVALRHLRRAVEQIAEVESTEELLDAGVYSVPNLFAMPLTLIVAFEPHDKDATVLDAADSMMRNVHHPARAATTWDQSAGHAEIRDEIVAKLYDADELSEGEALLVGPKFEEAAQRHDMPAEPDRRAIAIINLINGKDERARKARAILAGATGDPKSKRRERARLIVAALSEQIDSGNAKLRNDFETAVQDVLDTQRFGTVANMTIDSDFEPADMLEEAKGELSEGVSVEKSEWLMELGLKGAIALAALGHLRRGYATSTEEAPRPYQVIGNMLDDEFGLELLANAVAAWRKGERLPEYDAEKRAPKDGAAHDLRPATLGQMFSGEKDLPPEPSARDLCETLRKVLEQKFMPPYKAMMKLPEVQQEGIAPDAVNGVLRMMEPVRKRLELQAEKYVEFHGDPNGHDLDPDEE